jgi:3-phosphoshikimate 1-carboxyvinyltransferase
MKRVGYPPIRIIGQKITKSQVSIPANVSIVYFCVIVGAKITRRYRNYFGWRNHFSPYIKMTLALLNDLDIKTSFEGNVITVYQNKK